MEQEQSEYVIKTKRMNNYLYSLGFNSRKVIDKTGTQDYIYLFQNNELLQRAIAFYTEFKKEMY